jgi:hypothetical protein
MTGDAHNPDAVEPEVHGRFMGPPDNVMESFREGFDLGQWERQTTYREMQRLVRAGDPAAHAFGHLPYEMTYGIYAGIEDRLLEGAIDSHLHVYPDFTPRAIDIVQMAIDASKAKMRAIVCKDHFFSSIGQAWGAERVLNDLVERGELEQPCKVFGTYNLAWSHHPDQVHYISKYPNLGAIFFYTFTGHGQAGDHLHITDGKGELASDVRECIDIAAENRICIMTGHKKAEENLVLMAYAQKVGARVLITHAGGGPMEHSAGGTLEQCTELAGMGAYLEVNSNKWLPNMAWPCVDPNVMMEFIRAVGPEHCVANSDFGQVLNPHPLDAFRIYMRGMLHYGFSEEEITTMVRTNPARVLYLDD